MMDFNGFWMGWMWVFWILLIVGVILLIVLLARLAGGGLERRNGSRYAGGSRAREILQERYARGELTTEEYRERLRILEEGP